MGIETSREGDNMTKRFETHTGAAKGRFDGIKRDYSMADVARLSGSVPIEYSLA